MTNLLRVVLNVILNHGVSIKVKYLMGDPPINSQNSEKVSHALYRIIT